MSKPATLGKGLDALWGSPADNTDGDNAQITHLPIKDIVPNPAQPRRHFTPESLEELASSIRQQGVIQPLLVRQKKQSKLYEIVAGERRWRAANLAGLSELPVYIKVMTDEEVMTAALIENIQRENLSPIEEALALQTLKEMYKITQEELAAKLGKSRSAIANSMRLLQLSKAAQTDLQQGLINAGHARCLLSVAHYDEAQERLRIAIKQDNLNVRDVEDAVLYFKEHNIFPWEKSEIHEDAISKTKEEALNSNTHDENTVVKDKKEKASKRQKTPYIKSLQNIIKNQYAIKASISGDEHRGRIVLSYANAEELANLLQNMGINKEES